MKHMLGALGALLLTVLASSSASAFCGFYVAKADTDLFNEASQVVLVRDGDRTIMTLSNDFQGDAKDFAMVIPVPTFVTKGQIHIGERKAIDHLDAYTAPRLVEYFDEDPCYQPPPGIVYEKSAPMGAMKDEAKKSAESLGVTIEASYTVGEYDILILSAKQSDGLEKWLRQEGYKIPKGASEVLSGYIKQQMRFFVAKVNLEKHSELGFTYLRPIQVAYESPKFMLPIRLGTVNSKGSQELFVWALTRTGRVETTNYRTVKMPSDVGVPLYVKDEFGDFYKAMFGRQVDEHDRKAVFLEYAWDMSWCDPCAADPLSDEELGQLGVWWHNAKNDPYGAGQRNVFVSRLHVRYDGKSFPEDLVFQSTGDRTNFQGRYILTHAYEGATCDAADAYYRMVDERHEEEAKTLASLTGWSLTDIRKKMNLNGQSRPHKNWWERLWGE